MEEFHVEPNWKELATRYREERDAARKEAREFKKMYSELAKKWNDNVSVPCFAVWVVSSFVVSVVVRWAEDASLDRGIIQKLHNLVVEILRDRERVLVCIGTQKANHLVI